MPFTESDLVPGGIGAVKGVLLIQPMARFGKG
jgi:hypothetical protein